MISQQQRILGRLQKQRQFDDSFCTRVHHLLMKEYGWIPFEEFKKLPIPTVLDLLVMISEDRERENKEMERLKGRSRHGR